MKKNDDKHRSTLFRELLNIREYVLLIIIIILALLAALFIIKPWREHVHYKTKIVLKHTNHSSHVENYTIWKQHGLTVAGGLVEGNQSSQLRHPCGIFVDDDHQSIYIANCGTNSIIEWKYGAKTGKIVAGGNTGKIVAGGNTCGIRSDQLLCCPTNVIVDKQTDSLIICDSQNNRIMQWPRQNGTQGKTILSNIDCYGLAMDKNRNLYVSDRKKHEVRRWKIGEKTNGTIVAGGIREGNNLNELNVPTYIFVDEHDSLYISDEKNHRVMKWMKDKSKGIVVAGENRKGNDLIQLFTPTGVSVDHFGNVYVSDATNNRVMCWPQGSNESRIIVGTTREGNKSNQFRLPMGLSFDRQGNLYVADNFNHRVQKFEIDSN